MARAQVARLPIGARNRERRGRQLFVCMVERRFSDGALFFPNQLAIRVVLF